MPQIEDQLEDNQSEMQEIIAAPPHWLVQWGLSIFFLIVIMILGTSVLIRYPEIVKAKVKINSENAPKPVISKVPGHLVRILVNDNQAVKAGQDLAYIESTGDHAKIDQILIQLKVIQKQFFENRPISMTILKNSETSVFGELQESYQNFYQSFLSYKSSVLNGFDLKNKFYLQKDLKVILDQRKYLQRQKQIQEREYELAKQKYEMHKKLFEQKVEADIEFKQEEADYLATHYPLQQTELALLNNSNTYSDKEKAILELDNQVNNEGEKFLQALNSLISEIEIWKSKYILSAPQAGKVRFIGIIQEKQYIEANLEVFYIDPGNATFFGEMPLTEYNMGKIKEGQKVLIKLKSYPFEEYGILHARISNIGKVQVKDSIFMTKVSFSKDDKSELKKDVKLKNGMIGDAEIITEDASLFKRLTKNLIKITH